MMIFAHVMKVSHVYVLNDGFLDFFDSCQAFVENYLPMGLKILSD